MRIFISISMIFLLIGCSSAKSQDEFVIYSNDLTAYHENKYFDGFVHSKRVNTFTVVDDVNNTSGQIIVTMDDKADNRMIETLKKNDKVRIWNDLILESNPAKTKAYRVEVLWE